MDTAKLKKEHVNSNYKGGNAETQTKVKGTCIIADQTHTNSYYNNNKEHISLHFFS
jgi:hypothetical protein